MLSLPFISRILTLPLVLVKTVVLYYTTGTVYSRTNTEFNTLFKNIQLTIESHFGDVFQLSDIPIILYKPMDIVLNKTKSNPMVSKGDLKHFGEKVDQHSYWINKIDADKSSHVLIYFHGGGYSLPCFDAQLCGFIMMHHALPEDVKDKLSFVVSDYSLAYNPDCKFPRQIFETLELYSELLKQGYTKIHLIGDSAGGNLAIALLRCLSYPEELSYFDKYPQYDFKQFTSLKTNPASVILISPWVQPLSPDAAPTDIDTSGDLGATRKAMGEWYIGDSPEDEELKQWVDFSRIGAEKFENIELFKNNRAICIYGERENLRRGIENFLDKINSFGSIKSYLEKGGIHVGLFYVESLDFLGYGGQKAIDKQFDNKFSLNIVTDFLTLVVN